MLLASSAERGTDMPAYPHWYTPRTGIRLLVPATKLNNNILGNEAAGSELTAT
jgi:hypothetical protein